MDKFDIVGIGHAIMDVISFVDNNFLKEQNIVKGSMTLVNKQQAEEFLSKLPQAEKLSAGGSAANIITGFSLFGGTAAFIGKVKDDELGKTFRKEMQSYNITFQSKDSDSDEGTGRCLIAVLNETCERTMYSYLGAAASIREDDIDQELLESSRYLLLEGYLWDIPQAEAAINKAIQIAKQARSKVVLSLTDRLCAERNRAKILPLVDQEIDILFANEAEICTLFKAGNLGEALRIAKDKSKLIVITRGDQGCIVIDNSDIMIVPATPVEKVVDRTGAGDLFVSGFLFGLSRYMMLEDCASLASMAAAEIITQIGSKPVKDLKLLLQKL